MDGIQDDEELEDENVPAPSVDQLASDLLTLSLVPKARWQTLLNLDVIRERNKPKDAPKKPQSAPFFLPATFHFHADLLILLLIYHDSQPANLNQWSAEIPFLQLHFHTIR